MSNALSQLAAQLAQPAPGNSPQWDTLEAVVEVLAGKLAAQLTAAQSVGPGTVVGAVTPSDTTPLTSRALYVGGAGDVTVKLSGAPTVAVTFTAVPVGTILPISVVRVMATGTTATNINTIG